MKSQRFPRSFLALTAISLLGPLSSAEAAVVGFEGIPGTNDQQWHALTTLGVANIYSGFRWGYGDSAGPGSAIFPISSEVLGWAVSHVNNQDSQGWPAPFGVTGDYYASNAHGVISLWIDFQENVTFSSGEFSWLTPGTPPVANSSTVQLFGYGDSAGMIGGLLNSTGPLVLTDTLSEFTANFENVRYLEIRSNSGNTWFAVDNLQIGEPDISTIPEPGSTLALGLLLASALGLRHRRRSASTGA